MGAWVENKGIVLAFHHEAWKDKGSIDPEKKEQLLSKARSLMQEAGFKIGMSDRIRIIFAGDDLTDEDAMKALKGMAYSFRVVNSGLVTTLANHRLSDTKGVLAMLQWVEAFMLNRRAANK